MRVPTVHAPLGPAEAGRAAGLRRIRLQPAEAFAVADASDLTDGAFAYIDGVQVGFQKYEPEDPEASRPMVFTRTPTGQSLFVVCSLGTECRELVVIARRDRLVWALRMARMPLQNALVVLAWVVVWVAVTWRFRRSKFTTLGVIGRRLSVLKPQVGSMDTGPAIASARQDRAHVFLSGLAVDVVLALGIAAVGTVTARQEFAKDPNLSYYQPEFGPAMNVALGRGFVPFSETELIRNPGIDDFLQGLTDVPGRLDLAGDVSADGLKQFQRVERYMMFALGWTWRVVGLSHSALLFPWSVTVGLTIAAAFMFARSYVGRAGAVAASLLFLYGPTTLRMAHNPRDFLKAPFVFLFLACVGRCVARSEERAGLWAIGAGLALGIGSGFRMDVLIIAPLFAVVLFLRYRAQKDVVGPALTFAVSLLASAWPIASALSDGSNAAHVSMLGQVPDFWTENGGYPGANRWNALEGYEDSHAMALAQVAAAARGMPPVAYSTATYDRVLETVFRDQIRWAPADLISKVIQTHTALWELPMASGDGGKWIRRLQGYWRGFGGWIWLLAIAAVFLQRSERHSVLFAAFLIAVVCSWLQLSPRHIFHWFPVALVVQFSVLGWSFDAGRRFVQQGRSWPPAWKVLAIVIAFVAPSFILAMGRAQQSRVRQNLARELLSGAGAQITPIRATDATLKYATAVGPPSPAASAYAVLSVDWEQCPTRSIEIGWGIEVSDDRVLYRLVPGPPGEPGRSHIIHLRAFLRDNPSYFFVPASAEGCVTVRELPLRPDLPILWSIVLTPGWETGDHNLRFADEIPASEVDHAPARMSSSASGEELRVSPRRPPMAPTRERLSADSVGIRIETKKGVSSGMFWSQPLVAEESGRYRFEFDLDGSGDWRASVDDPTRKDRSNAIGVGEGTLAHPAKLLIRPLPLPRRVILDEWVDSGERVRLYLRSASKEENVSVSALTASVATPRRVP